MIAGRYTLERQIGRGGSGTVHLARDEVLGRLVAIKRIGVIPGSDSAGVERAEREARLAAALNHPHVVSVFDLVDEQDVRWLVMEYVDGETLSERVATSGPLAAEEAAALLAQTADALVEAHAHGIVHRDVKPSNILISGGSAKLNDFGIARSEDDHSLTQTGLVTGSPAYLAPEVASGASATPASDVWSLGATLYHAVTGTPPYDVGDNLIGALYKIVHEDPPRLPDDHPLAGLLTMMMNRDPDARWPMARVRDELARVARGQASTVAPAPVTTTARRERTGELPTLREPAPAPGPPRRRRAARWAWPVAAAALALAAIAAAYVWAGRGTPEALPEERQRTSPETSQTPVGSAPPATAEDTRKQMDAFIGSYLSTVTSDPRDAFDQLTPEFQDASGGFEGYMGWWSQVRSASLVDVTSDPSDLTVGYTVDYVMKSGERSTQRVRLQLERRDDRLLIAGEG
ncbi:serine/threonine-protein kinase [Nocardioides sp. zg-1228]|uniref:serine/threonine-protein kinase n=1 Tax=Nocardioides sp. zg-1228 TaxID=2763008 RepID=UPI0016434669|nr:serine/threonine-protein kinase [Nocardioides sp. zg-1228]MBC2934225.1 serine/threonine protein kinase [Nocardioides sp. zg-1228]QSF58969.1 serine/threonine protein kinase [Nocardioides sp. zg-1228]